MQAVPNSFVCLQSLYAYVACKQQQGYTRTDTRIYVNTASQRSQAEQSLQRSTIKSKNMGFPLMSTWLSPIGQVSLLTDGDVRCS
jgi:hypothetical protein